MNDALLASVRGLRVVIHVLVGVVVAIALTLDGWLPRRFLKPERALRWWASALLDVFNIQATYRGVPVTGPHVTVANHVSWLDIMLIAACEETRFVAKSDVRDWPIIGFLTAAGGTFFINRGKGGSAPLLARVTPHLQAGGSFTFFPEGTTTDGSSVATFHPRVFEAAIEARCPVQPVTLRYGRGATGGDVAPFIGDDDLVSHVLRLLREPALSAEVVYEDPIRPGLNDRDALAWMAQTAIEARLRTPLAAPEPESRGAALPA